MLRIFHRGAWAGRSYTRALWSPVYKAHVWTRGSSNGMWSGTRDKGRATSAFTASGVCFHNQPSQQVRSICRPDILVIIHIWRGDVTFFHLINKLDMFFSLWLELLHNTELCNCLNLLSCNFAIFVWQCCRGSNERTERFHPPVSPAKCSTHQVGAGQTSSQWQIK